MGKTFTTGAIVISMVALCVIAWNSTLILQNADRAEASARKIEARTEKVEQAARAMMDTSDCGARCPPYRPGGPGHDGRWVEGDNSENTKCVAECDGEWKQKLRQILAK